MQNSNNFMCLGGGRKKFWGEVMGKGLFFQRLDRSTATSFTGLYLKYHTKSSYIAVYSLMKIIAVPCSAVSRKSPMPCTSEGTDLEPLTKTETARGSLPSAC